MTQGAAHRIALTADGALVLSMPDDARALCADWVPRGRRAATDDAAGGEIEARLDDGATSRVADARPGATFAIGGVAVHVEDDGAEVSGGAWGSLSLGGMRASLRLPVGAGEPSATHRRSALTASAALLLGRLGRALAHAGAVVHPETGVAWLLVGDSHAGKSTTVANLARAGWGVLADDTVSLSSTREAVVVEGWPRTMHMDAGWGSAAPQGRRIAVDPLTVLDRAPLAEPAALGGLLFPRVDPERPTEASARSGADALALLLRQSPWLFADAGAAPSVLALLRRTAMQPAASLSLGIDSFADAARLDRAVRAVTG